MNIYIYISWAHYIFKISFCTSVKLHSFSTFVDLPNIASYCLLFCFLRNSILWSFHNVTCIKLGIACPVRIPCKTYVRFANPVPFLLNYFFKVIEVCEAKIKDSMIVLSITNDVISYSAHCKVYFMCISYFSFGCRWVLRFSLTIKLSPQYK